jgi:hypothetical protein
MSKKSLRFITEHHQRSIEEFNKSNNMHGKHGGIKVGKIIPEHQEALFNVAKEYLKAPTEKNSNKYKKELIKLESANIKELYYNLPDLKISDSGSIQSLNVSIYSAETNEDALLHKLYSKAREAK